MVRKFGTPVELPGDPTDDLHAAPKQYVDTGLAGKAGTTHAAEHATAGSDPVSPASIGAATTGHDHTGTYQPADADLTAIAGLSPSNDDVVQRKAGAWTNRTPAQLLTDLGAVPTSRTLTASTGLTGGGTLAADRSFAVAYGSSSGTAVQGNDARVTADQAAGTASIRTLGTGATQAAAGNHTHAEGPAAVLRPTSNQSIPSGGWYVIPFADELIDTHNAHSIVTSNSRFIVPTGWGGIYDVFGVAYWFGGGGGSVRAAAVVHNSNVLAYTQNSNPDLDNVSVLTCPMMVALAAGDYVELGVYQNSGANRSVLLGQTSLCVAYRRS